MIFEQLKGISKKFNGRDKQRQRKRSPVRVKTPPKPTTPPMPIVNPKVNKKGK
jgi:hypothetical protein